MMGFGRRFHGYTMESQSNHVVSARDSGRNCKRTMLNSTIDLRSVVQCDFHGYELSLAIANAVREYDPKLKLMGLSNQNLVKTGKEAGLEVRHEVFADRTYEDDGTLVSRRKEGAMITDTDEAVKSR